MGCSVPPLERIFSLKDFDVSKGGTEHPMTLYKRFRGKAPDPKALLKRAGLIL